MSNKKSSAKAPKRFAFLFQPVNAAGLGVFRILFGVLLLFECWRWWEELDVVFLSPRFNIPLDPFGWVTPLPALLMQTEILLMGAASLCLMLGIFVRSTSLLNALLYGHFLFAEKMNFNNHYYLVWLLLILFTCFDSTARFSLENQLLRRLPRKVPYWQPHLLKLQMLFLYFFGGIAKLNPDWLEGQPMILLLQSAWGKDFFLSPYAGTIGLFMSWFGVAFDLIVGFALLHPVGRWLILPFLLGFHLSNKMIFGIGIFPFFCLATFVLYPPGHQIEWALSKLRLWKFCSDIDPDRQSEPAVPKVSVPVVVVLSVYLVIHLLMPFRHFLIEGNYHWTREQYYFAWTMKLDSRSNFMAVEVYDPKTKVAYLADPQADLFQLPIDPIGVWDYVNAIESEAIARGLKDPEIYVLYISTLNGRPLQLFLNPDVPINQQPRPAFVHANWVLPLNSQAPVGGVLPNEALNQRATQWITQALLKKEAFRRSQGVETSGYFRSP